MMTEYLYTRPTFVEVDDGIMINLNYVKSIRKYRSEGIVFEVDAKAGEYCMKYPNDAVRDMMFEGFIQSIGKREISNNNNE